MTILAVSYVKTYHRYILFILEYFYLSNHNKIDNFIYDFSFHCVCHDIT